MPDYAALSRGRSVHPPIRLYCSGVCAHGERLIFDLYEIIICELCRESPSQWATGYSKTTGDSLVFEACEKNIFHISEL